MMANQWSLLALVAALAAGLVTTTMASLLVRSRQTSFFRHFLTQVLLFNLLILGGLTISHIGQLLRDGVMEPHPALLPRLPGILAPLKVGWLYAFTGMTLLLPGQEPPDWFRRRLGPGLAVLFAVWGILLVAGLATGSDATIGGSLAALELVVLGGAASAAST